MTPDEWGKQAAADYIASLQWVAYRTQRFDASATQDLVAAFADAIREAEERGRKAGREQLEAEVVRSFAGHSVTVGEFIRRAREIGGRS